MFTNIVFAFIHAVALGTCLVVTFAPWRVVHPVLRIIFGIMSAAFIGLGVFAASIHLAQ